MFSFLFSSEKKFNEKVPKSVTIKNIIYALYEKIKYFIGKLFQKQYKILKTSKIKGIIIEIINSSKKKKKFGIKFLIIFVAFR